MKTHYVTWEVDGEVCRHEGSLADVVEIRRFMLHVSPFKRNNISAVMPIAVKWTTKKIKKLLKRAKDNQFDTSYFSHVEAFEVLVEFLQTFWVDSDDGGDPPDIFQKAANALERVLL